MGRIGRKKERKKENQPLLVLFPNLSHIINCREASKYIIHNFLKSMVISSEMKRGPAQVHKYKIGNTQIEG